MKKIAILGKPNVGKSSLFNRFLKERKAITSDVSGTTRDVNLGCFDINGSVFGVLDTGGIDDSSELFSKVKELSLEAGKKADMVLYMVDGKIPPQDDDKKIFFSLQKSSKICVLVVNKIDNDKQKELAWEYTSFGTSNMFFISVSHNRGVLALLDFIKNSLAPQEISTDDDIPLEDFLEEDTEEYAKEDKPKIQTNLAQDDGIIKVGIIGRVNVGKSSLLNALLGTQRSVVSDIAGTTIDPVDEEMNIGDSIVRFVDTAGIRRRGKIDGIERYALDRTKKILEKSNIVLLVLDVSSEFVELDEKISGLVDKYALGVIIILNKWDIRHAQYKQIQTELRRKFKFLEYAPLLTVSALQKRHIQDIKDKILEVYQNYSRRVPTALLNSTIAEASVRHPLPSDHGKLVRIYYATQYQCQPPQIAVVMNRPNSLHFSYKRYLVNFLRDRFNFEGTPILITARKKSQRQEEEELE